MPPLEVRRLAVAAALTAVSREALPARVQPPQPVERTLKNLAAQIGEVVKRLDLVETALLESVWDREAAQHPTPSGQPVLPPVTASPAEDDTADAERLSVPALPLTDVRMSNRAAKALFGE